MRDKIIKLWFVVTAFLVVGFLFTLSIEPFSTLSTATASQGDKAIYEKSWIWGIGIGLQMGTGVLIYWSAP